MGDNSQEERDNQARLSGIAARNKALYQLSEQARSDTVQLERLNEQIHNLKTPEEAERIAAEADDIRIRALQRMSHARKVQRWAESKLARHHVILARRNSYGVWEIKLSDAIDKDPFLLDQIQNHAPFGLPDHETGGESLSEALTDLARELENEEWEDRYRPETWPPT